MKKLIYKEGNVLTDPSINVIGHQANCQNTFGSGVAASIRELYPTAYEADTMAAKNNTNVLGNTSYVGTKRGSKPFVIFNLYGQNLYGRESRKTNYEALYSALEKMRTVCDMAKASVSVQGLPMPTVGFPYKMGCDRGGGSWDIVERLIEVAFDGYEGDVVIVKYNELKNR
jgi:O-acetyl-ADP-ribose deacetylase (regulator of RNase III)